MLMLRSEAIAIIKRGLGFRQTQDTAIIAALQEAQRDLELGHTLPNFLLAYDVVVPIVAGTALISLPTGVLRFHEDYELYYVNSNAARVFVPRRTYDEAYKAYVASGVQDDSALYTTTA